VVHRKIRKGATGKRFQETYVYQIVAQDVNPGGIMNVKGMSGTLLALAFVVFSLFSLISVNHTWDNQAAPLADTELRVSELGLRFNMQR
jgi:hypothetical protein